MAVINKKMVVNTIVDNMNEKAVEENTNNKVTKKQTEEIINSMLDLIKNAVAAGDTVQINDFGSFVTKDRAARTGLNPRTGEQVQIPAQKAVAFKVATAFKRKVNV